MLWQDFSGIVIFSKAYSCPNLVVSYTEELISRPFLDENSIWQLFWDRVDPWPAAGCFYSRPLSLLYWISLNCQVPWGWHCIFRWICLQNAKMDFFPTVLIAFPKTNLDFADCCMNLFSTMTMFMFLCKYDRPSIILFVVFPSPLKRRSTQSSSCLLLSTCKVLTCTMLMLGTLKRSGEMQRWWRMTRRSGGHFGRATHIDPLPTTSMRMKMRLTSTTFKSQSENLRMSLESHLKTGFWKWMCWLLKDNDTEL